MRPLLATLILALLVGSRTAEPEPTGWTPSVLQGIADDSRGHVA